MALELLDAALEELAPPTLVYQQRLEPPEGLGDRVILLLETLEPPVDFVKMPEDLPEPFLDLLLEGVETSFQRVEPPVDDFEAVAQECDELLVLAVRHDERCLGPQTYRRFQYERKCVESEAVDTADDGALALEDARFVVTLADASLPPAG